MSTNEGISAELLMLVPDERRRQVTEMGQSLDAVVESPTHKGEVETRLRDVFGVDKEGLEKIREIKWDKKNNYCNNRDKLIEAGVSEQTLQRWEDQGKSLGRGMVDTSMKKAGRGEVDPIYVKCAIDLVRGLNNAGKSERTFGAKQADRAYLSELKAQKAVLPEDGVYKLSPVDIRSQIVVWTSLLGNSVSFA